MPGANGVYTGGGVTVVMDPAPVAYIKLFYPRSEPERYLRRQAEKVAILARTLAPRRTGLLASSIHVDQNRNEKGQYAFGFKVGTAVPYAGFVHDGTGPSIRTEPPGSAMKFHGTDASAGEIVFSQVVRHPGTPAQPFLSRALIAMVV